VYQETAEWDRSANALRALKEFPHHFRHTPSGCEQALLPLDPAEIMSRWWFGRMQV
jgi:hypothetical protein